MSERFEKLTDKHIEFIKDQHLYFVGTAGAEGFVNVSPKGMDSFRVIDHSKVAWLNLTGSGNETAAHVLENGRMTVMFCSFDKQPLIMRLYGQAKAVHPRDGGWGEPRQGLVPAIGDVFYPGVSLGDHGLGRLEGAAVVGHFRLGQTLQLRVGHGGEGKVLARADGAAVVVPADAAESGHADSDSLLAHLRHSPVSRGP